MNEINPLQKLVGVRQPRVRPAYRILNSAHNSVVELFDAVDALAAPGEWLDERAQIQIGDRYSAVSDSAYFGRVRCVDDATGE